MGSSVQISKGKSWRKFHEVNILKESFVQNDPKRSKKRPEKNQWLCCLLLSVNKPWVSNAGTDILLQNPGRPSDYVVYTKWIWSIGAT